MIFYLMNGSDGDGDFSDDVKSKIDQYSGIPVQFGR